MSNQAEPGQVFVCGACGKISKTRRPSRDSALGWDASCMLNAVLCHESSLRFSETRPRRVVYADPVEAEA